MTVDAAATLLAGLRCEQLEPLQRLRREGSSRRSVQRGSAGRPPPAGTVNLASTSARNYIAPKQPLSK